MATVTSKTDGNTVTVYLEGKIDSTNASEVESAVVACDTAEKLVVNVEKLTYISSAGLRVLLRLRKKHEDLEILGASTEVYEIFDMTGFTDMMHVTRAYRTVSVEGCEVIGRGANGEVYRIDPDTVVKVYVNADSLDVIEHERDVARKALVLGIPTAISYDVVRVGDHYASVFEMLNAKSFSKLLATDPENLDRYAAMYIDLLKLVHGTVVPAGQLPDQRAVAIDWVKFLEPHLPAAVYKKLVRLFDAIPASDRMIHGDYHTKNLMLQNDEVILIDMDTLAVGHPILELGSMYNAYLGFSILDHSRTTDFLGFDYEIGKKFWKKSLSLYYGTEDAAVLAEMEKKATVVGAVRLLRRSIRRHEDKELIDCYTKLLCELVPTVDSLV